MSDPITFSNEYWTLALPGGWSTEPAADEDCFAVEFQDGSKKIFVRTLFPDSDAANNIPVAIAQYEQAISEASRNTLNATHTRFVTENGSMPPYSTLLLASYDEENHFGLAAMTFVASDHQICISVHDYWSDDQVSFERFFRDILRRFRPVAVDNA